MRKSALFLTAIALLPLTGCKTIESDAASVAQNLSTATPTQVTTLAEAEQAVTLADTAADIYVKTGKATATQLTEIKALATGVHSSLLALESANASGKSLAFSSFNAALQGYDAYTSALQE